MCNNKMWCTQWKSHFRAFTSRFLSSRRWRELVKLWTVLLQSPRTSHSLPFRSISIFSSFIDHQNPIFAAFVCINEKRNWRRMLFNGLRVRSRNGMKRIHFSWFCWQCETFREPGSWGWWKSCQKTCHIRDSLKSILIDFSAHMHGCIVWLTPSKSNNLRVANKKILSFVSEIILLRSPLPEIYFQPSKNGIEIKRLKFSRCLSRNDHDVNPSTTIITTDTFLQRFLRGNTDWGVVLTVERISFRSLN